MRALWESDGPDVTPAALAAVAAPRPKFTAAWEQTAAEEAAAAEVESVARMTEGPVEGAADIVVKKLNVSTFVIVYDSNSIAKLMIN